MYDWASERYLLRAFKIEAVCQRHAVPLGAVALQFSLRDPRIVSTIVGVSKPERLEETVAFAEIAIPDELWQDLAVLERI